MELEKYCKQVYLETVNAAKVHPDLIRALRNHERTNLLIGNLVKQFKNLPFTTSKEHIRQAIEDFTKWFIILAEKKATEGRMSHIAKMLVKQKEEEKREFIKRVDDFIDGGQDVTTRTKEGYEINRATSEIPEGIL